jgi:branched-chain amino acid transport system ATP-binding protein
MQLVAHGVSVRFGGLVALDDVSLTLSKDEIVGLIGPNGAGKTTMINVLSGFQKPHLGGVTIDGRAAARLSAREFARAGVVRTFQAVRLFKGLSVGENVEVSCVSAGMGRQAARVRAAEVLDYLRMAAKAKLSTRVICFWTSPRRASTSARRRRCANRSPKSARCSTAGCSSSSITCRLL